jgi:hypothetical protein
MPPFHFLKSPLLSVFRHPPPLISMAQQPLVDQGFLIGRGFTITLRHTTICRAALDGWSTRHRDLYLTTHNTHKRQTSALPAGFEPAIPASERQQTHAVDRAATGIGSVPHLPHLTCCTPTKSNLYLANSLTLLNKGRVIIYVILKNLSLKTGLNEWYVRKNKPLNSRRIPHRL